MQQAVIGVRNQTLAIPHPFVSAASESYIVKLAETSAEIESALRLRHQVFRLELGKAETQTSSGDLEFDEFDFQCRHLIVVDRVTSKTVGTYRLNSFETAGDVGGFYSHREFTIEDLPNRVLRDGIEIGRACVAREHRNTKVLFFLLKGLATYLRAERKRYFFGCSSIFSRDEFIGQSVYRQLSVREYVHPTFRVTPRDETPIPMSITSDPVKLPNLFSMYLRIGAKICGPPIIDHDFGTTDFFLICDTDRINPKYRRMFF